MLKKQQRLTKKAFGVSFKRGRRVHTPTLQLIYDATSPEFHGAAVVGKKVYKKAVARNRLRRQLYGALYRNHRATPLLGTFIIVAKPPARELSGSAVSKAVADLLSSISHQTPR